MGPDWEAGSEGREGWRPYLVASTHQPYLGDYFHHASDSCVTTVPAAINIMTCSLPAPAAVGFDWWKDAERGGKTSQQDSISSLPRTATT